MKKENPNAGHRSRMKARYLKNGIEDFHDHEVLEILLYYCYPQKNTNDIAHRMLKEFGSLHNLFEADVEILTKTLGCTENIAILLNLIPQLANRYFRSRWSNKVVLDSMEVAAEFAMNLFVGNTVECFYVLCLDAQQKLIQTSRVSKGTLDETAVYPREVVREVIKHNAASVIVTHNHPGGTIRPSPADNEATRIISEGLNFIGVTLIDHIIVAGDKYFSYAARNHGRFVKGYSSY